jgi:hypothetical protein
MLIINENSPQYHNNFNKQPKYTFIQTPKNANLHVITSPKSENSSYLKRNKHEDKQKIGALPKHDE